METVKIAIQIQKVYADYPSWKKMSRISSSVTDDHSSIVSWTGKLETTEFTNDVVKIFWKLLKF